MFNHYTLKCQSVCMTSEITHCHSLHTTCSSFNSITCHMKVSTVLSSTPRHYFTAWLGLLGLGHEDFSTLHYDFHNMTRSCENPWWHSVHSIGLSSLYHRVLISGNLYPCAFLIPARLPQCEMTSFVLDSDSNYDDKIIIFVATAPYLYSFFLCFFFP
jgi:hypothetical protein